MNPVTTFHRALIVLGVLAATSAFAASDSPRERLSFDADWRFTKDDPAGTGDALSYAKLKPWLLPTAADYLAPTEAKPVRPAGNIGDAVPYTQPGFDDGSWRTLNLPHDWGIEGPFKQEYPGETGKLPWWGIAWYRKHFTIPAQDSGKRIYLDIDGAMSYAAVWLNGQLVGGWPYGYASWRVDLTPYVKFGAENVVAIRLDNPPNSSRWYPGGGIYRNVWLTKTAPVHLAHWGTYVTTPIVAPDHALVDVQATVENDTSETAAVDVTTSIYALDATGLQVGAPVASTGQEASARVAPHRQALVAQTVSVSEPRLWSIRTPNRYVAVTTVTENGKVVDEYKTPFGIRTIAFSSENGFLLNGERVPIQGVCDHHDLGAIGAAVNVHALARQLRILRAMGCNAIRTSHNPPAPELLELADQMGFVVMDEAFDCWARGKTPNDYHLLFPDWHEQDLRAYVRRDRNHPSVILWSIGNEIPEQGHPEGWKLANELAGIVREEDRTRYITSACNNVASGYNGFQTVVDAFGYNYKPTEYPKLHAAEPQLPLYGSETASCVSSRGEYFFPVTDNKADGLADFQVSDYDLSAPRWAWPPDVEFRGLDEAPYVAGEFVWTGFDYLGEPTPYGYGFKTNTLPNFTDPVLRARAEKQLAEQKRILLTSRSSYFGIVDLAGFRKDRYYLYQARWRPDFPMAHILPHWTWPERVGQVTPVHVFTSGDAAELFLNGKSLGLKKRGPLEYRLRWDDVVYEPGELKVVAYKNGARWAEDVVRTAGPAVKLTARVDRPNLSADGSDLAYIKVAIDDANGTLVPRSHNVVQFEVSGPADVIATDNGDATSLLSFQSKERPAFNGRVLAIVRTRAGQPGTITVRATSDGLAPVELTLTSR
ncbi:MAG TPA: beta-galactosidase GalB [Opitutaceae bacterium]|nr:beta-galactosidase GalB [Opitutaceae bacterium]